MTETLIEAEVVIRVIQSVLGRGLATVVLVGEIAATPEPTTATTIVTILLMRWVRREEPIIPPRSQVGIMSCVVLRHRQGHHHRHDQETSEEQCACHLEVCNVWIFVVRRLNKCFKCKL